jgi:hypothetical protein
MTSDISLLFLNFQAIYWDDKTVFMEHEFIGPEGFVHAVAVCRQRVIDTSAAAIAELLLQLHCAGTCRPAPCKMPPEVGARAICLTFFTSVREDEK